MQRLLALTIASIALIVTSQSEAQAPFTEEAASRGISFFLYTGTLGAGRGMALNDFDNDGDLDFVMTGHVAGDITVYENTGLGTFIERPGLGLPPGATLNGLSTADYDADGDLDLYISNYTGANILARNDGNLAFSNVTTQAQVGDTGHSTGTTWGDYDGDGWLDLYVANYDVLLVETNHLYRNNGDGTFEDVTATLGLFDSSPTLQPVFFDYDRDGDVDLYVGNDKGASLDFQSKLWRNDGGVFSDVSNSSGAGVIADSMGVGHGDPNRDGYLDLCITNTPPGGDNLLLINQQDGTFADASASYGIQYCLVGWAAEFFDFDNDSFEDLLVLDGSSGIPTQLFRGSVTTPWLEIGSTVGLVTYQSSYCATPGDIDGDGDLDVFMSSTGWPLELQINNEGQNRNSIQVRLDSSTFNRRAVGAIVEIEAGGITQTRGMYACGSYKNSLPYALHFGLDAVTEVDSITVHWPGGAVSEHGPFAANQTVVLDDSSAVIPEPVYIRGDANSDGSYDIADAVLTLSHLFLAEPVVCHRALDANEDEALDVADAVYSLGALFGLGAPVGSPHPACGSAPSALPCTAFPGCP